MKNINLFIIKACAAWVVTVVTVISMLPQAFVFAAVPASVELRGLWVASAYNLDWPSRSGLSNAELRREADVILQRAVSQGFNAIFLQVRPTADAFYHSEIFPWSNLLSGTQGEGPPDGFDPLGYWIERGNELGIEIHAWINPYRITTNNQNITNVNRLNENHPARKNPELVIAHDTAIYFDPGNPAARQLILDGVKELLENYNLDGIHMDDYFYPSRDFRDNASFAQYGGGMDLHDWRRENVNSLIRGLQNLVRETNPQVRFGISPTAIWKNNTTDVLGSATRGQESYNALYADTRRWVIEGWVDYIAPQIYWYFGHDRADYEIVLSWWENVVRGTNVDLYIGHAAYQEADGTANWASGEIVRQLERNARSDVVRGSIFFRAASMSGRVGEQIAAFYERHVTVPTPAADSPTVIMDTLTVVQPRVGFSLTDAGNIYCYGSGVPDIPIYVNGQLVTNRTAEGFFSVYLPLVRGANTFVFTQEGQTTVTRTVTNNAPPQPPPHATMPQAGVTTAFPISNEYARVGSVLTLSATAPAGATVTAEIGGSTVQLTQQNNTNLTATADSIYSARFSGTYTLNAQAAADAITEIGRPVYTMTWNGQTRNVTAEGKIFQLGNEAPFFAEITAAQTWVFPGATTTGGSHWLLYRGQKDRVSAVSGSWTRLASGAWVENANIRTYRDANFTQPNALGFLSEGRYLPGEFEDVIIWEAPFYPSVYADFDGNELIVSLGMQSTVPQIFFNPQESLFSNIRIGVNNGAPSYFMTLSENLEGFYTEYENGQLRLVLKRRRAIVSGSEPFAGFTFVIDAGHGGNDSGAIGPMGAAMTEAMLTLTHARLLKERLERLGAEVVLVRERADQSFELINRVNVSRDVKPDMFISMHINATAETTNATGIHGFTVWYRNHNSRPVADVFANNMYNVNPFTNRNRSPNQANFFVCRPTWSPAILLEASFINNINDFAWMINERRQVDYAWGVVNTLLKYYGKNG